MELKHSLAEESLGDQITANSEPYSRRMSDSSEL